MKKYAEMRLNPLLNETLLVFSEHFKKYLTKKIKKVPFAKKWSFL